ncbi:MAG: hypothetical protein IPH07_39560 [Deltaproteobacteria bacterium]|nr:hypothetical protein [Deltaproteobacteria bacterium]MBK8713932.1 hypothetical protein [Deltaproteobacteria bacterium]MBP7289853.1 hypothetical protein [Nannocystaceae bacterium]
MPTSRQLLLVSMAFLAACGGSSDGSGGGGDAGASTGGDEALTHGFVALRFEGDAATYAGTDTIVATMNYGPCLTTFYADNPQMRQYGNFGQQIFGDGSAGGEGWKSRLCGDDIDHSPCEIVWITQRIDTVQQLAVTYQVSEAMNDGTLLFGPIPTSDTALCDGEALPVVTVDISETTGIRGIDAEGHDLWRATTVTPNAASTGQSDPMVVSAAPVGG